MKAQFFKQGGYSLLEMLTSTAILIVVIVGASTYFYQTQKIITRASVDISAELQIGNILDSIRSNVKNYQINFELTKPSPSQINEVLKIENLPMAWDISVTTTADHCPDCRGRYGFIIAPVGPRAPGLYMVYVRISFSSWVEKYKDYQFIASVL